MKFLQDLPFEVIDCHIHPAHDATSHWGWFLPPQSVGAFVDTLRKSGISRACGSNIQCRGVPSFSGTATSNKAALAFRDQFPDFYLPGVLVHPHFPEESCLELERYHNREGFRWVGEVAGYVMGFGDEYVSGGAFQIYDLAQKLGTPVNFHCNNLEKIPPMCEAFPRLPFVLAHPGRDKQVLLERLALVAKYPNLYLDLSGGSIVRWGMVRCAIDKAGAEKLLFGTDFPISNPFMQVVALLSEPLSDGEREALFSGNFKRLTGLDS